MIHKELNLVAPINETSYGLVATNIVNTGIKLGYKINLFPIYRPQDVTAQLIYHDTIKQALENAHTFDKFAPCVRIWHQFDMSLFVGKGLHIGFPIFELDTFTKLELHHLSGCDKLMVCSDWAKNVIKNNFLSYYNCNSFPVEVVPLGVDREIFYDEVSRRKPTIFINIGKWEVRKGHDVLVDWFCEAFNEDDNVQLWLANYNPFYTEQANQYIIEKAKSSKLGSKIVCIPHQKSQLDIANIMRQSDCGVFPSRAEGWNLEALEMLSCGKEVIITDYSGQSMFIDSCYAIPIIHFEKAFGIDGLDRLWFNGQGNWGVLDGVIKNYFINQMQFIHKRKQNQQLELNQWGIETAKKFSWENAVKELFNVAFY